jgi:hypothetical protein
VRANREARSLTPEQAASVLLTRRDSEQAFLDVIERGIRLGEFTVADPQRAVYAAIKLLT